jgi:ComF family protein
VEQRARWVVLIYNGINTTTMNIIEQIVRIFAPHICIDCGIEADKLLCPRCANMLIRTSSRCYRCQKSTEAYRVCAACEPQSALRQVVVGVPYRLAAKGLVHRLKFDRAQAATGEIAELLAPLLNEVWGGTASNPPASGGSCGQGSSAGIVLVHVPTATNRVRARGYDQAGLLARELSRRTGLPRQTLLARVGQVRQVGAGRTARLQQLQRAFRPIRPAAIIGRHVVLVDDVLTTGATLEMAARALLRAGAAQVSAVVFAQA